MEIRNDWLILKGKFICDGFYFEDNGVVPVRKIVEFNGEEGEIFAGGESWKEVWKDRLYVGGSQRLERVIEGEEKANLLNDLKKVQEQYND
jgi:hypothetical protein